ncbi:MAG: cytochrome c [Burkholderiales bacterium]|nr:cytochrome c [Burkholderiales bacterium]
MRAATLTALVTAGLLAGASGAALAQGGAKVDFGKREYLANCANCHGLDGKGDGPYKPYLAKSAGDLTTLAKRNQGVFPYYQLIEMIDGRRLPPGHGRPDMPIWGADYLVKSARDYTDVPYDPELYVRGRIMALVDYIQSIQTK